jgi:hypothetical protein
MLFCELNSILLSLIVRQYSAFVYCGKASLHVSGYMLTLHVATGILVAYAGTVKTGKHGHAKECLSIAGVCTSSRGLVAFRLLRCQVVAFRLAPETYVASCDIVSRPVATISLPEIGLL